MPLYKKTRSGYKRKKNVYYKRTFNKGAKALTLAKKAIRQLNSEKKWVDKINLTQAVSSTAAIVHLLDLQQGTGAETRIGDQVKLMSMYLRMRLIQNQAATLTSSRVMIVRDSQCNGAAFVISDLLEQTGSANAMLASPLNLKNKHRFKVLFDRLDDFVVGQITALKNFTWFQSLDDLIRFKSNNGDVTDIASASYFLVFISTEPTNTVSAAYQMRTRFVDN